MDKLSVVSEIYKLNSGEVRISIFGDSDITILLAPDPPNSLEHYEHIIQLLSSDYRVVSFEPVGFGYSHPSFSFSFDTVAFSILISEVLDATNTSQAIISIPCVLGFAAIHFAQHNPDRVIGMIVIQTPDWEGGKSWVNRLDRKNILRRSILGQISLWMGYKKIQKSWIRKAEPDKEKETEILRIMENRHSHGYNFCLASPFQTITGKDILDSKPKIKVPSVLIWGSEDSSYPTVDTSVEKYFDKIEEVVTDAGHFPEMSNPNIVQQALVMILSNI